MKNPFKEPFVHFLFLGGLLFAVDAWRETKRPAENKTARIEVTAAVIERLRAGYERQFGQVPGEAAMRGLVAAYIREEVLCREALAMGLDRDDTIVRQRLAQKMEFLTDDLAAGITDDKALREFFDRNAARYARPARLSFRHVYVSRARWGAGAETAALDALAVLKKGASDETLGDAFLHGFEFAEREPQEIAALFGGEFAAQIKGASIGSWSGPVPSSYGLHLVRIDARSEARSVKLDEVRTKVERDFTEEQRRTANRKIFERLKQRYAITVDEAAITNEPAVKLAEARK